MEEGRGDIFRVCNCKDRYVHFSCQLELATRCPSSAHSCTVCRAAYTNVKCDAVKSELALSKEAKRVVLSLFGCISFASAGVVFIMLGLRQAAIEYTKSLAAELKEKDGADTASPREGEDRAKTTR